MNYNDLLQLKAELLCYGINIGPEERIAMQAVNPYLVDRGFIHAAHFTLEGQNLNTCVSEAFCTQSPYTIKRCRESFVLYKEGTAVCNIDVLPAPDWCGKNVDGEEIGRFLRPHSKSCIVCWPLLSCDYYLDDQQCHFCSMGDYHIHAALQENTVIKMIETALSSNPFYEVSLGGGIFGGRDRTFEYFSSICQALHQFGVKYISVEIAPPENLKMIDLLHDSGATAIIMNLEIVNEQRRKMLCPGKGKITLSHYFSAFERAINTFGRGNVASVLLAGIQPKADIIDMSVQMIDQGVIPTILPFKPVDGCKMKKWPVANPDEYIEIALCNCKQLKAAGILASRQAGCTRCNACSLETLAEKIQPPD